MRATSIVWAALVSTAFFIGCGQADNSASEAPDSAPAISVEEMKTPTTIAVKIEGMSCPSGCAAKIEEECGKLAGVGKSKVNFDEGVGYFTFDASMLSEDEILKCISNTNGGGIYTGTILKEESPAETEETTSEEAVHEVVNKSEAHS